MRNAGPGRAMRDPGAFCPHSSTPRQHLPLDARRRLEASAVCAARDRHGPDRAGERTSQAPHAGDAVVGAGRPPCALTRSKPRDRSGETSRSAGAFEMARFTARPKKRGTPQGKTALGAFQGAARRRHRSPARTRRSRARLCRYACRRTMTIRHCVRAAAIHAATGSIGGCCSAIPNNACDFAFCEGRVAQFMRRCCELQRACAPVF